MRKTLKLIQLLGLVIVFAFSLPGTYVYSQDHTKRDSTDILEKVFIHTDRETYSQGEDIWFKAYLVNGSSCKLSVMTTSLHVELISPEGLIIDSRILNMMFGVGNGDFHLGDTLKTGRYTLRAYTNHMRNFGSDLFFTKDLIFINTRNTKSNSSLPENEEDKQTRLAFFPEGGSLVEDVNSKVAFKAVDYEGSGVDIIGEIYTDGNVLVTSISSQHKGMGSFYLKPLPGMKYYAVIKKPDGNVQRYSLPDPFVTGIVMDLKPLEGDELTILISTNQTAYDEYKNRELDIVITEHGSEYSKLRIKLAGLNNKISIPSKELPGGVIRITILDDEGKPLCERLAFIPVKVQSSLMLLTDKQRYEKRDSVNVTLSLSDSSGIPDLAFLSLSAVENIEGNRIRNASTICSWFLVESEIRGSVEEPAYYFNPAEEERYKNLDLLLMVHGWRDFSWKYIDNYYPYEYGFNVSGRVRKKLTDSGIRNSSVSITLYKGKENPYITSVTTDTTGKFSLEGITFNGTAFLIATAMDGSSMPKGLLIIDSAKYSPPEVNENRLVGAVSFSKSDKMTNYAGGRILISDSSLISKYIQIAEIKSVVIGKYKLSDTINIGEVKVTARRVYAPGSIEYRSRYNLHGSSDKTIVVTPEYYKTHDIKSVTRYLLSSSNIKTPIFVVDGSRVPFEIFCSYPWDLVARLDVLTTMASISVFGPNTEDPANQIKIADGVLAITSRSDGPLFRESIALHTVKKSIKGYDEPRIFYSPVHTPGRDKDLKPDLRTSLYWNPDILVSNKTPVTLKYYNNDNPGRIKVTVEGMTSNGIPVSGSLFYEIK